MDAFTLAELRSHSQYLVDSLATAGVTATASFSQGVSSGQRAISVIDGARAAGDWEHLKLAEARLPDVCDEALPGDTLGLVSWFIDRGCRKNQVLKVDRQKWLDRKKSHLARRITWTHEWLHTHQETPVANILKSHCWFGLSNNPVPAGSGPTSKAALAHAMMQAASDAEEAFREAEVRMTQLCNFWALCKMVRPAKADPVEGAASKRKQEALKDLCDGMKKYCCAFEDAAEAFETAHTSFAANHPNCKNGDGDFVVEGLQLVSSSGSKKNVGNVNLTDLKDLVDQYAGVKGTKATATAPATGMSADFEEKKDEIKCRLG